MGKKIFVSYKYGDNLVFPLKKVLPDETTVRHYVDELQGKLDEDEHINKGEKDDEGMGVLKDSTIASKLGDKIFDSTVTIVFVSKGMNDFVKSEREQWIPWEVSYSLSVQSRKEQKSKTNAVLAVVLPDENDSYEYYITQNLKCGSRILNTPFLFNIIQKNMFNIKESNTKECNGNTIYYGASSYIASIKWNDFTKNIDKYINEALENQKNIGKFDIKKRLD